MPSESVLCGCGCGLFGDKSGMIVYHTEDGGKTFLVPNHLNEFYQRERDGAVHRRPMTGMDIVKAAGVQCMIGDHCRFYWRRGIVTLTREVATGTDPASVVIAYHELAHTKQPRAFFFFLWIIPWRWFVECDAWGRVFGQQV